MRVKSLSLPFALVLLFVSFELAPAYEVKSVTNGAVITGKVTYKGKVPALKKILITKDQAVCGKGYIKRHEVNISAGGGLEDVVVTVEGIKKGKPWKTPKGGYVLDQKRCDFHPYLMVVPQRAKLLILNSDPVLHNIHTYELIGRARRTLFNVAQPKFKRRVTRTIRTRRGKAIRVECDAHSWMLGWLYVTDNPYYAIAGKDGSFSIKNIPPGTYKIKVWHPFLGTKEKTVTLSAKGKVEANFELTR